MPISREKATAIARQICLAGSGHHPDAEVVVVVTDKEGAWVGVAGSVHQRRTADILRAALDGAGRRNHSRVIDMETD